jgi:hypothetical protein
VVLGQVVGGVLLTQPAVDVLVHGWQRVLVLEIGAGDEHQSGRSADGLNGGLPAVVAPAAIEPGALRETALVA